MLTLRTAPEAAVPASALQMSERREPQRSSSPPSTSGGQAAVSARPLDHQRALQPPANLGAGKAPFVPCHTQMPLLGWTCDLMQLAAGAVGYMSDGHNSCFPADGSVDIGISPPHSPKPPSWDDPFYDHHGPSRERPCWSDSSQAIETEFVLITNSLGAFRGRCTKHPAGVVWLRPHSL